MIPTLNTNYNYLIESTLPLPEDFNIYNRRDPDSCSKKLYDDILLAFFLDQKQNESNHIKCYENFKQQYKNKPPFYTIRVTLDDDLNQVLLSSDYIGPSVYWAQQANMSDSEIRAFLRVCRTIGGHILWPRGSDITFDGTRTINQAKGGSKGVYDRTDWTLLLIKLYYSCLSEGCPSEDAFIGHLKAFFPNQNITETNSCIGMYYAIKRAHEVWFKLFPSFRSFCKQFCLIGSLVDEDCNIINMTEWFPIFEKNNYIEFVEHLTDAIKKRNRVIMQNYLMNE